MRTESACWEKFLRNVHLEEQARRTSKKNINMDLRKTDEYRKWM